MVSPRIQSITKREKSVILKWSATPGQNYRVQFKPKLATGDWTDLGGDVTATGVSAAKVDDSFGGAAQRFYRVVELP